MLMLFDAHLSNQNVLYPSLKQGAVDCLLLRLRAHGKKIESAMNIRVHNSDKFMAIQ
jgi:hypothetical protein